MFPYSAAHATNEARWFETWMVLYYDLKKGPWSGKCANNIHMDLFAIKKVFSCRERLKYYLSADYSKACEVKFLFRGMFVQYRHVNTSMQYVPP